MKYFLFWVWGIFFISIPLYSQEKKTSQLEVLPKLSTTRPIIPAVTFRPYRAKKTLSLPQAYQCKKNLSFFTKPAKVSLISISINTWLENPQNFEILREMGRKFPIADFMDNLQSYNPELEFNDPELVQELLNIDIYTPYTKVFENKISKPLMFSDVKEVVTYARKYNIYGISAGKFPYFGRPVEGDQKMINLGILPGQLSEIRVKLPDTEIFLAAVINIVPNWLSEGLDIYQINQQEMQVSIFAFNKKGKLIGGMGRPITLWSNAKRMILEQMVSGRIWQPSISREFYILPALSIVNTELSGSEQVPNIELPDSKVPRLAGWQNYIISSIQKRQEQQLPLEVELFDSRQKRLLPKAYKNTDSSSSNDNQKNQLAFSWDHLQNNDPAYQDILVRLQDQKSKKPVQAFKPSNEGAKLRELLSFGFEKIGTIPFTYSNQTSYTNQLLPFETAVDPVIYRTERRNYYSLPHNLASEKKKFKKQTRNLLKNFKHSNKERMFWFDLYINILQQNNLVDKELFQLYNIWTRSVQQFTALEVQNKKVQRQIQLVKDLEVSFDDRVYKNKIDLIRKYAYKPTTYTNKLESLENKKVKLLNQVVQTTNKSSFLLAQKKLEESYSNILSNEQVAYKQFVSALPSFKQDMLGFDPAINSTESAKIQKLYGNFIKSTSETYQIDKNIVLWALMKKKYSPEFQQLRRIEREHYLDTRILYYEGFALKLMKDVRTKFYLEDRLVFL
ncbi:MAG: hypothetical protein ACRCTQ_05370 [Brevinemataceae bacterium]